MDYRICVSLLEPTIEKLLAAARQAQEKGADLVEFRLDALAGFAAADGGQAATVAGRLLSEAPEGLGLVFTCRTVDEGGRQPLPDAVRKAVGRELLMSEPTERPLYLDAERGDFPRVAQEKARLGVGHVRILGGFHAFHGMPADYAETAGQLRDAGADVVKMAVTPPCATAAADMLAFFQNFGHPFVLAGMGLTGVSARLLSPLLGAEFTFAALEAGKEAAPGQLPIDEMLQLYRVKQWTEETLLLGVIGNPLAHSLSPLLHNTVFREKQLDAMYLPFEVTGDPLEFIEVWSAFGLYGASVTMPHKVRAMQACTELDAAAEQIGAVNTLKRQDDGGFFGANADAAAVVASIAAAAGSLGGKKALVLGAGGAARAAAVGLRNAGAQIVIANRTLEKAQKLAEDTGGSCVNFKERTGVEYDVLVNATSVGMYPETADSPMPEEGLRAGAVVMDMVYNPLETKLLAAAARKGLLTVPGTEMFVRQAAHQLRLWFDIEPPLEVLREVMLAALR